jgi:hypothetical protein
MILKISKVNLLIRGLLRMNEAAIPPRVFACRKGWFAASMEAEYREEISEIFRE